MIYGDISTLRTLQLRLCQMRVLKYYVEIKHYLKHENKVKDIKY